MSEEARYHVMILLDGLMAERDRWQQALARVQTVEAEDICYRHLKILTHIYPCVRQLSEIHQCWFELSPLVSHSV